MTKKCLDEVTHFHIMHRKLSGECAVKKTFLKGKKMNLGKVHLSWQKYFEKETHGSLFKQCAGVYFCFGRALFLMTKKPKKLLFVLKGQIFLVTCQELELKRK